MATAAAFSRLQLAAALIEYDNDKEDPDVPRRSAQESAIFAHLRRNPAARPDIGRRKSDFLGVSLPSEGGTRESTMMGTRRSRRISRASTLALRNPFGADGYTETDFNEEDEEQEMEVDLQSWGLDAFIPKDKKSAKARGKEPAMSVRSKLPASDLESPAVPRGRGVVTSQSMNLEGQFTFENATIVDRRRSVGTPLELAGADGNDVEVPRRRAASRASLLSQPDPTTLLPFPTAPVRSPTPGMDTPLDPTGASVRDRRYSSASLGSRYALDDTAHRSRQHSITSIGMGMLQPELEEDNPFALERPTTTSRFDPKAGPSHRPRTQSNASLGSRMMLENDAVSTMTGDPYHRDRPYSRMDLLRPKVLVMPSPLQSVAPNEEPAMPSHRVVEGFESTKDGPPLPPGARATRRLSASLGSGPLPSNAFTPNPMMDLTNSQNLFRNTLVVGGQSSLRDTDLPRATEDGEQIQLEPVTPEIPVPVIVEEPPSKHGRLPGKLYGKSLIDNLEARKQEMRSKQRTFRGDERPSMMARTSTRSSTLIDPASLKQRPQRTSVFDPQSNLTRRGSQTVKPLLTFDSEDNLSPHLAPNARTQSSRSVFGTDTLWEREMEKLKIIQAREAEEEEARRKREAEEELNKAKKKKKKGKGSPEVEQQEPQLPPVEPVQPASIEPPTLPDIQRASTRRPVPQPGDADDDSESDEDVTPVVEKPPRTSESWHAGSSDDEDNGPRRTTGVGLRYPVQQRLSQPQDDDSEEDVPLSATVHKAIARATMASYADNDSDDEDKPLAQVIHKAQTSPRRPQTNMLAVNKGNDSDDDEPLGLRASRVPSVMQAGDEDEDDMPLAFHPEHQRRTQYQMFAQQQQAQAQQQMMMQAQMQNNMYMNAQASMMGSFYGVPPMMGPAMPIMPIQAPIQIPSPPPIVDEGKFGLVDRWRRDVAIDGQH